MTATAADNQAARAFWLQASRGLEPVPPAADPLTVAFEGVLDADAQAVLARFAHDALGRFTLLCAGVAWLLAYYRGAASVVLRAPGLREDEDARDLPLPVALDAASSVRGFVRGLADVVAAGYTHRRFPVDELLRCERALEPDSVGDVLVCERALHAPSSRRGPYAWRFELDGAVLRGHAPAGQAPRRLAHHLSRVLAAFTDPERRLDLLDPLPPDERAQIRALALGPRVALPLDVVARFEAQAARTPAAVALASAARTRSYAELNRDANRLAHALRRDYGVGPEARVGLALPRGEWAVVAILGVLKAGAAYVPLEPGLPPQRRRVILADSRPALLLTLAESLFDLDAGGLPLMALDLQLDDLDVPEHDPTWPCPADSLAYVLHTSGSTGRPKGCGISRRSLSHYLERACATYFDGPPQALLFTPLAFDLTVTTLLGPLLCGGRLRLSEADEAAAALGEVCDPDSPIDFVKLTPSHVDLLGGLRAPPRRKPGVNVVVGGESLLPRHLEVLHARFDQPRVFNEYGPTEATVGCSVARVRAGERIDVGRPMAGTAAYVLDARGDLAPLEVVGEICLGGDGLARGYLGRPDLTAERFVPDPCGHGARLYRTGDLGRMNDEGRLECLGRRDRQLKLRGMRLEPGEIEHALEAHPQVRQALVVARADAAGEPRLVAYLVGERVPDAAELRHFLAATLPEPWIPQLCVPLAGLPLDAHGKLDFNALPAPAAPGGAGAAPSTPLEQALAEIWRQVLGLERVWRDDDFFALGGHSLAASRVVVRVAAELRAEIDVGALFEAPTLAQLAARVEQAPRRAPEPPSVTPGAPAPLSYQQERLWLQAQLEGGEAYHISLALRLRGALDVAALERALAALAQRQSALRTAFELRDGVALQSLWPAAPALARRDLSGLPDAQREDALARLGAEQAARPFDLGAGPPLRLLLAQLERDHHVLLGTLHHVIFDEWSLGVFVHELSELYAAEREGRPARLPALACDYAEYARRQRRRLDAAALETQLDYWRRRLAGAPTALRLPYDRPVPAARGGRSRRHPFALPAELAAALREHARRHGVTLFMTLLGGFDLLLWHLGAGEDVVVGTSVAGRDTPETEGLVGFFVNQLVLRCDLSGDPTWSELLGRVRLTALEAWRHQDVPFQHLVAALKPPREPGRSPLFQAKLAFQSAPAAPPAWPGLTLDLLDLGAAEASKFDLLLVAEESPEGILATFHYADDVFEAPSVARLAWLLERALGLALAQPEARLSSLRAGLTAASREWDQARAAEGHARGALGLQRARRVSGPGAAA